MTLPQWGQSPQYSYTSALGQYAPYCHEHAGQKMTRKTLRDRGTSAGRSYPDPHCEDNTSLCPACPGNTSPCPRTSPSAPPGRPLDSLSERWTGQTLHVAGEPGLNSSTWTSRRSSRTPRADPSDRLCTASPICNADARSCTLRQGTRSTYRRFAPYWSRTVRRATPTEPPF